MMDSVLEQLKAYVSELVREQGFEGELDKDSSLVLSGLLDSFAVIRLVVFMEKTFGVNFAGEYFDNKRFETLEVMVEMVKELTKKGSV